MAHSDWRLVSVCPESVCDERLWHAGLSLDGSMCLISGFEDNVFIVWDVHDQKVLWRDDGVDGNSELPPLDEWIDDDGYVTIDDERCRGRYRVFGLNENHARTKSAKLNQKLEVSVSSGLVLILDEVTGLETHRLPFDAFSGDWAFASFSDDDSTIAVIEPYSVTFFGRERGQT